MGNKCVWVIGDIHGMSDPLRLLFQHIRSFDFDRGEQSKLVFLGDYIDYGPSSREVIDILLAAEEEWPTVFIAGNHDDMLLHFVNQTDILEQYGNVWFNGNGGQTSIVSFDRHPQVAQKLFLDRIRQRPFKAEDFVLEDQYLDFFQRMSYAHQDSIGEGEQAVNFAFTHAGLYQKARARSYDPPDISIERQLGLTTFDAYHACHRNSRVSPDALHLWNRVEPDTRFGDFILVHGHTPTLYLGQFWEDIGNYNASLARPLVKFISPQPHGHHHTDWPERTCFERSLSDVISVNVDTGAVFGGALTALILSEEELLENQTMKYLQVRLDRSYREGNMDGMRLVFRQAPE